MSIVIDCYSFEKLSFSSSPSPSTFTIPKVNTICANDMQRDWYTEIKRRLVTFEREEDKDEQTERETQANRQRQRDTETLPSQRLTLSV